MKPAKKNPFCVTTLTNHFLIASPSMEDKFFKESVIYICEHNTEGAIGLVINHPIQYPLEFLFNQMKIDAKIPEMNELPLCIGGPMHQERGFVIHGKTAETWRTSLRMTNGLCVTTSHDILNAIAVGSGPKDFLVILGYAGWDSGQIEKEIASNSWLIGSVEPSILFDVPTDKRWEVAIQRLGFNMNCLSTVMGHA